jgi:hypothetical protein
MSVKDSAIVTVSYQSDQLILSDNEENPFSPSNPEAFTTNVTPNGKIGWEAGEGVSAISITVDSGQDLFKKLPSESGSTWEAKIDNKQSGEAKYTITYTIAESGKSISLDPVIKITPPPPPPQD